MLKYASILLAGSTLSFGAHHEVRKTLSDESHSEYLSADALAHEILAINENGKQEALNKALSILCNDIYEEEALNYPQKTSAYFAYLFNNGAQASQQILNNALVGICCSFGDKETCGKHFQFAYSCIDMLLEHGANPNNCFWDNDKQDEPFSVIIKILEHLEHTFDSVDKIKNNTIINQTCQLIERLGQAGADLNQGVNCEWGYSPPLFFCINNPEVLECMLKNGAHPNDLCIEFNEDNYCIAFNITKAEFERQYGPVSDYNKKYSLSLFWTKDLLDWKTRETYERNLALKKSQELLLAYGANLEIPVFLLEQN